MNQRLIPALLALAGAVFATLPATSQAGDHAWRLAPQANGTAAPQYLNPAGEGRRQWLRLNCYSCHGMNAAGGMGPAVAGKERGDVAEAVLEGKDEGMRSYRGYVTSRDIDNLTAYLNSIGTAAEPLFNDWWVPYPPK